MIDVTNMTVEQVQTAAHIAHILNARTRKPRRVLAETTTIAAPKVTRKVSKPVLSREQKAQQLVDAGRVRFLYAPGLYEVQSSDFQNWYKVDAKGEGDCQCADHQRGGPGFACKHVLAAKLMAVKRVLHAASVAGRMDSADRRSEDSDSELASMCKDWCGEYGAVFDTDLSERYITAYRNSFATAKAWSEQLAALGNREI